MLMIFETPDSSMVTPIKEAAPATVLLLWVMTINWDFWPNSINMETNRPTLASSRAASISSKIQKGLGLHQVGGKEEGHGSQGSLPTGKEGDVFQFFARGLAKHLNTRF
jgi:hypothetical protein